MGAIKLTWLALNWLYLITRIMWNYIDYSISSNALCFLKLNIFLYGWLWILKDTAMGPSSLRSSRR